MNVCAVYCNASSLLCSSLMMFYTMMFQFNFQFKDERCFFALVMLMIITQKLCSLAQWLSFIEQRNVWWKKDVHDEKIECDCIE